MKQSLILAAVLLAAGAALAPVGAEQGSKTDQALRSRGIPAPPQSSPGIVNPQTPNDKLTIQPDTTAGSGSSTAPSTQGSGASGSDSAGDFGIINPQTPNDPLVPQRDSSGSSAPRR